MMMLTKNVRKRKTDQATMGQLIVICHNKLEDGYKLCRPLGHS